ncbi:MAG: hemolysin family protein [Gammaproteobacteria bacterium]
MNIAILVSLILLNGVFAMAEIALVTARKNRLQRCAADGDRAAAVAVRLGAEPTRFLSTIQIGITAIGILNGIVGEAALAAPLAALLQDAGLAPRTSASGATAIVVVGITYVTIVVGELVPKRLAQLNAVGIARVLAPPIALLALLSRPFVWLLSVSTDGILRALGAHGAGNAGVTEEDIDAVLVEGSAAGVIEQHEHAMVRKVFQLDERPIAALMTPRSEIVCFDIEQPAPANLAAIIASDHSRFPVCRGGPDDILGVLTAKRLLRQTLDGQAPGDVSAVMLPAVYVPESLTGMKLLEQFRETGMQMVFVVDEYGQVLGLVTLQDILEALVGEFTPRNPEDAWAVQRDDGSWLLDGFMPIPELRECLGLAALPGEDQGRYQTLSGLLMWLFGKVPRTGDSTAWRGWRLDVVDLDGNRIDKVLALRIEPAQDAPAAEVGAPADDPARPD